MAKRTPEEKEKIARDNFNTLVVHTLQKKYDDVIFQYNPIAFQYVEHPQVIQTTTIAGQEIDYYPVTIVKSRRAKKYLIWRKKGE